MRYLAIATDYDGTLATNGKVAPETLAALHCYRKAGGRLVLVTGRELADLQQIFPEVGIFDGVVAENGAVFYQPCSDRLRLLGEPLPEDLFSALVAKQVNPIRQGQVLIATWQPHEATVIETIQTMGLNAQIIMNKRAVMVLPAGVNKATGLSFALEALELASDEVAGIGDAENDRDLLLHCGLGVAVENALPDLKKISDRVTTQSRGAGVQELVDWILSDRY